MSMNAKTEVMQCIMMGLAEANFFASSPVLMHHAETLCASAHPPDLLINSFTLAGIAHMLCHAMLSHAML